jgi:glycosyltransferase involved in cell wall biosynthesis
MPQKKIIILGPAHPLRGGGITTYNQLLCKALLTAGHDCSIVSFSLQYPSFLFPGKSQYTTEPAPAGISIKSLVNSVNPFNWIKVGFYLRKQKPDILIVRYWLPFMGPCLGTILRILGTNKHTEIICVTDNIIPHEKRFGDSIFTKYFIAPVHRFITMSTKVRIDLQTFTNKPSRVLDLPLFDNFGKKIPQQEARKILDLPADKKILLFFGFIRKYKGLDILIEAIGILKAKHSPIYNQINVVIAGEFYEDEEKYKAQITELGIAEVMILKSNFIPDDEVKNYLSCADVLVQPYKNATQSGVTPLAYEFELPMIVTKVGGLADNVPHGLVGIVCEPNAQSFADAIEDFFALDANTLLQNLQTEKKQFTWEVFVSKLLAIE